LILSGKEKAMKSGLARIVPEGAKLERLATGFMFTEGPIWDAANGCLFFSDIPGNKMRKWTPGKGIEVFREPSGKSNGLTLDKKGRLLACEHANRRVSLTEKDGTVVTIADRYEGKRLNSPNDVVVKSDGSIYFSDPPYGLTAEFGVLGEQELPFQGVYRFSPDGKTLTLLVDDFEKPNGLAFSPDESLLYIDDTDRVHVCVFDVNPDGTISNGRVFAELEGNEEGNVDGMKVDSEGNVYVTGPGGISIFAPSGEKLGRIDMPEVSANMAWGDDDWNSLYITASTSLYKIRLGIEGIRVP
jgi:gluconolactonase